MIDNVESVLPPFGWAASAEGEEPAGFDPDLLEEILDLCRKMVEIGKTAAGLHLAVAAGAAV